MQYTMINVEIVSWSVLYCMFNSGLKNKIDKITNNYKEIEAVCSLLVNFTTYYEASNALN